MQVNISARHGNLSAETQEKIQEKVERLRRLFDRVTAIGVTTDLEHRDSPSVELKVSVEHNSDFVATASSSSVMAALDGAIHKIEQQLRKHKDKRRGHRSQALGRVESPEEAEQKASVAAGVVDDGGVPGQMEPLAELRDGPVGQGVRPILAELSPPVADHPVVGRRAFLELPVEIDALIVF